MLRRKVAVPPACNILQRKAEHAKRTRQVWSQRHPVSTGYSSLAHCRTSRQDEAGRLVWKCLRLCWREPESPEDSLFKRVTKLWTLFDNRWKMPFPVGGSSRIRPKVCARFSCMHSILNSILPLHAAATDGQNSSNSTTAALMGSIFRHVCCSGSKSVECHRQFLR